MKYAILRQRFNISMTGFTDCKFDLFRNGCEILMIWIVVFFYFYKVILFTHVIIDKPHCGFCTIAALVLPLKVKIALLQTNETNEDVGPL